MFGFCCPLITWRRWGGEVRALDQAENIVDVLQIAHKTAFSQAIELTIHNTLVIKKDSMLNLMWRRQRH